MADYPRSRRVAPTGAARSDACTALGNVRCSTDAPIQEEHTRPRSSSVPTLKSNLAAKPHPLATARFPTADWVPRSMQMNLRTMLKIWPPQ